MTTRIINTTNTPIPRLFCVKLSASSKPLPTLLARLPALDDGDLPVFVLVFVLVFV